MSFERKLSKKFWVSTCQTWFHTKLLKKFWSKIISNLLNVLWKKIIKEILSFYVSNILSKKIIEKNLSFYVSNILSKKIIQEILIKTNFLLVKCPLKENYRRKFESLHVKLSKQFWSKMSFYVSLVLSKKIS